MNLGLPPEPRPKVKELFNNSAKAAGSEHLTAGGLKQGLYEKVSILTRRRLMRKQRDGVRPRTRLPNVASSYSWAGVLKQKAFEAFGGKVLTVQTDDALEAVHRTVGLCTLQRSQPVVKSL